MYIRNSQNIGSYLLIMINLRYAGIVWLNKRSIMEVEGTWYRVLKAATGAVVNIKHTSAEILLGVPPLEIQNGVNSIKYNLKMNILPSLQDPLKELITIQLEDNTFSPITSKTKDVFNFLKWKQNRLPKYFSINERNILRGGGGGGGGGGGSP